jgi:zinc transport system substrate-binding protein
MAPATPRRGLPWRHPRYAGEAPQERPRPRAVDVAGPARVDRSYQPLSAEESAATRPSTVPGGPPSGASPGGLLDPHFWLDPTRLARAADAVAGRLSILAPADAATFAANAARLRQELTGLDGELRAGLASCRIRTIVTGHDAFGYLAQRYGLNAVAVTGLSPETEPKPADLAEIARFVSANGIRTIYAETLVSPAVAQAVARATGADLAILDPVEGNTTASRGTDYLAVMRANLVTLRRGQDCP